MSFILGGSTWEGKYWKPVYQKSLQQNLTETSLLIQTAGLVIPEALAFRAAEMPLTAAAVAASRTAAGTVSGAAAGSSIGLTGAGAGAGLITAAGLAQTGLKVGAGVYMLEWLQKNWYIPVAIIGGVIILKYTGRKK